MKINVGESPYADILSQVSLTTCLKTDSISWVLLTICLKVTFVSWVSLQNYFHFVTTIKLLASISFSFFECRSFFGTYLITWRPAIVQWNFRSQNYFAKGKITKIQFVEKTTFWLGILGWLFQIWYIQSTPFDCVMTDIWRIDVLEGNIERQQRQLLQQNVFHPAKGIHCLLGIVTRKQPNSWQIYRLPTWARRKNFQNVKVWPETRFYNQAGFKTVFSNFKRWFTLFFQNTIIYPVWNDGSSHSCAFWGQLQNKSFLRHKTNRARPKFKNVWFSFPLFVFFQSGRLNTWKPYLSMNPTKFIRSSPSRPKKASRMAFVNKHQGFVVLRQLANIIQWCHMAIHAEDSISCN